MSMPKLNIGRHYCHKFIIGFGSLLTKKKLKELLDNKFFDSLDLREGINVAFEYKIGKKSNVIIYHSHLHESSKPKKKVFIHNQIEFVDSKLENNNGVENDIKFTELFSFLELNAKTRIEPVIGYFAFPRSKFNSTIANLPYKRDDLLLDKKIKICGLDLEIGEGKEQYKQFIRVDDDTIYQQVGLFDINGPMTLDVIEDSFKALCVHTMELMTKKK